MEPIKVGDVVQLRFGCGFGMLNPIKALEDGVINLSAWTVAEIHGKDLVVTSPTRNGGLCTYNWVTERDIVGRPIPIGSLALATLHCG